jgi:hypothetical protein
MIKLFHILIIFIAFFNVFANGIVVCNSSPTCSWDDFSGTISNLIKTVVEISFWIAFIIIAVGAFYIMFAGAKPDFVQKGHSMIWTAIIAYALILFSGIFFDIILEIFKPQLNIIPNFQPQIVLADTIEAGSLYKPLRDALMSTLKCGSNANPIFGSQSLGRLFNCVFEIIDLLKFVAVIFLSLAIIISAGYIITASFGGAKNVTKAKNILFWSVIGFVIILLADVIKEQIIKLLE